MRNRGVPPRANRERVTGVFSPWLLLLLLLLLSLCCGGIAIYAGVIGSLAYFNPVSDDDGGTTIIENFPYCNELPPPPNSHLEYNSIGECWDAVASPEQCCDLVSNNTERIDILYEEFNNLTIGEGTCSCNSSAIIDDVLDQLNNSCPICPAGQQGDPGPAGPPGDPGAPGVDANQTAIIEEVLSQIDIESVNTTVIEQIVIQYLSNTTIDGDCSTCPPPIVNQTTIFADVNVTAIVEEVLSLIEFNDTCSTCPPGDPGPIGPQGPAGEVNETAIIDQIIDQITNITFNDVNATCLTCPAPDVNISQIIDQVIYEIGDPTFIVNETVIEYIVENYLSNYTFDGDCSTCPPPIVNQTTVFADANVTAIVEEVLSLIDFNSTCSTCSPGLEGPPGADANTTAIVEEVLSLIGDVNGTCLTCLAPEVNISQIIDQVIYEIGDPTVIVNETVIEQIVENYLANYTFEGDCSTCPPPIVNQTVIVEEVNTTAIVQEVLSQIDVNGTCATCPPGDPGPAGPAGADANTTAIVEEVLSLIDVNGTCITCPATGSNASCLECPIGEFNQTLIENIFFDLLTNTTLEGDCSTCPESTINTTVIVEEVLAQIESNATCLTCPVGPEGPPGEFNVTVVEQFVIDYINNATIEGDCSTCPSTNQTVFADVNTTAIVEEVLSLIEINATCSNCEIPEVNYTQIIEQVLLEISNNSCSTCSPGPVGPAGPAGPAGEVNQTAIINEVLSIIDANGTCVTCPDSVLNVTQVEQIVISLLSNDTNCCEAVSELNMTVTENTQDITNIYGILGNLTDESCCELAQNNSQKIEVIEGDINVVEGDVTTIYGILANLTDESCCDLAQNNSEAINEVEGDVTNIYGILGNLTDEVGENTECCEDNQSCCQNNTISIETINNNLQNIYQQLANASQLYNGQVKINDGNGVKTFFAVPEEVWINITYASPLGLSPFPITQWPSNMVSPTDSDIYLSSSNTFIENPYLGQVNLWRIFLSFNKGPGQRKAFTIRLRNPSSGFITADGTVIENTEHTGFRSFSFTTISDSSSLPPPLGTGIGYLLELRAEVPIDEIRIESITRISLARNL